MYFFKIVLILGSFLRIVRSNCFLPSETSGFCKACEYNYYNSEFDINNPHKEFLITSCKMQSTSNPTNVVYINNSTGDCSTCTGTLLNPYNNIVKAMLLTWKKNINFQLPRFTFYLFNQTHWITKADLNNLDYLNIFRRNLAVIIIMPVYCQNNSNINGCMDVNNVLTRPTIYLKTYSIRIFIHAILAIYNINFDGTDLHIMDNEKFLKCDYKTLNMSYLEHICGLRNRIMETNNNNYSIFNLESILHTGKKISRPGLTITYCSFSYINYGFSSISSSLIWPCLITIVKSNFFFNFLPGGIFSMRSYDNYFFPLLIDEENFYIFLKNMLGMIAYKFNIVEIEIRNFNSFNMIEKLYPSDKIALFYVSFATEDFSMRNSIIINNTFIMNDFNNLASLIKLDLTTNENFMFANAMFENIILENNNYPFQIYYHPLFEGDDKICILTLSNITITGEVMYFVKVIRPNLFLSLLNFLNIKNLITLFYLDTTAKSFSLKNINFYNINCQQNKSDSDSKTRTPSLFWFISNATNIPDLDDVYSIANTKMRSYDVITIINTKFINCNCSIYTSLKELISALNIMNSIFQNIILDNKKNLFYFINEDFLMINNCTFNNINSDILFYSLYGRNATIKDSKFIDINSSIFKTTLYVPQPKNIMFLLISNCVFINVASYSHFFYQDGQFLSSAYKGEIFNCNFTNIINLNQEHDKIINILNLYMEILNITNIKFIDLTNVQAVLLSSPLSIDSFLTTTLFNINNCLLFGNGNSSFGEILKFGEIIIVFLEINGYSTSDMSFLYIRTPIGYIYIINSFFFNLYGKFAGALIVQCYSFNELLIYNCRFKNITAFTFSNIIVTLLVKNDHFFNITDNTFFKNINPLYFSNCDNFTNFIQSRCVATLKNISYNKVSFKLFGIIRTSFLNCIAINSSCLEFSEKSQIYMRNTVIKYIDTRDGAILLKDRVELILIDIIASDIYALRLGGVFYSIEAKLNIICGLFESSYSINGGFLYGVNSNINLFNITTLQTHSKSFGGSIYIYSSVINISDSFFSLSISKSEGGFIFSKRGSIQIFNSIFDTSYALFEGGGFYIESPKNLYFNDIVIKNCEADKSGAIFLSAFDNEVFKINKLISSFHYSDIPFFHLKDCKIKITNSIFSGSNAVLSSIFVESLFKIGYIQFEMCIFVGMQSNSLFSSFDGYDVRFDFVIFHDLKNIFSHIVKLSNSNITVKNSYFQFPSLLNDFSSPSNIYNLIFLINDGNIFNFENSVILGEGNIWSCFSLNQIDEINIKNSLFIGVYSNNYESILYLTNSNKSLIFNNLFAFCTSLGKSLIYLLNSDFWAEENIFIECNTYNEISIINNVKEKISLNITFFLNKNSLINNNMIMIYLNFITNIIITNILIDNSFYKFIENQAIRFYSVKKIILTDSLFIYNNYFSTFQIFAPVHLKTEIFIIFLEVFNSISKFRGSVFYIDCNVNMKIINSYFANNTSTEDGGVMSIYSISEKSYLYINNTVFYNNSCKKSGGVINFRTLPTYFYYEIIFFKDNFGLTSNKFSSIPSFLKIFNQNKIIPNSKFNNVKSGGFLKFNLKIYDDFNNFQELEKTSYLELDYDQNDNLSIQLYNNKANIINGIAIFDSLQLIGTPGLTYKLTFHYRNFFDFYNFTSEMIVSLRLCARGEEYINGQCSYCKKRYYSLLSFTNETKTNEITCLICENNADCLGYDSLIPKYGYWRFNENSSLMVKCKLEKSCPIQTHMLNLGLEESNYSNFIYEYKCTKGYKGNLCSNCDEGYGKNSDAECVVCSNSPWLFVRFFFFSLALMLFMIFQAKSALSFKESDSKKRSLLKIIVDHMSFITFIYRFNIEWEPSISSYFTTTDKFITTSPKEVFNFNCFLILFFHTNTNTYHINSAIVSFSPLFFGIITLFLQYSIEIIYVFGKKRLTIFKNKKRKNSARKSSKLSFDEIEVEKIESLFSYRKLKKRVIALLIVLYYNFYPRLILNGFQLFKCIELNNENEVYLEEDPDLICWQDRHLILVAGIGVPNLIIWGILMPIIISFIAFKMKILMILTMRYDYWKDLLNYVTIDYHPDKYYWETFLYLQKFFVVGVSISTSRLDPVSQGGLMIMLFLCFFLIYEFYGPSKYIIVNKYRVYSYMTIISTAAFAILISNEFLEPAIKLFYLCCLLVVNIFFYVGWGFNFVKVQIDANKVILDKISGLAKKITSRKTIKSQINP